jgi:hypothetical protein
VLIVAKSVLANRGFVHGINTSPRREEMICMSGALALILAKSVVANPGSMAWITDGQLQLDNGGENS